MIDPDLLSFLVCPESRMPLAEADDETLAKLNAAVRAGGLKNQAGRKVESLLDGGLVCQDGVILYPIIDGIPILLIDEGIPLDPLRLL